MIQAALGLVRKKMVLDYARGVGAVAAVNPGPDTHDFRRYRPPRALMIRPLLLREVRPPSFRRSTVAPGSSCLDRSRSLL